MSKSLMGALLGLAAMTILTPSFEGTVRMGAWAGFLMGAGLGCTIVVWQAGAFRKTPARAMSILAQGFMMKLAAIAFMGLVVFRYEALSSRLSLEAFLVGSFAGMFALLIGGTIDNTAVLHKASAAQRNQAQAGKPIKGQQATVTEGRSH